MVDLLSSHIAELHSIFKAHHVTKAEVFGSALSANFNQESDIDILVSFDKNIALLDYADNYFELKERLEELLQRRVDLVSVKSLKNPVLIESINKSKQSLYAA
jgi:predicted nucleotidyltransferase